MQAPAHAAAARDRSLEAGAQRATPKGITVDLAVGYETGTKAWRQTRSLEKHDTLSTFARTFQHGWHARLLELSSLPIRRHAVEL